MPSKGKCFNVSTSLSRLRRDLLKRNAPLWREWARLQQRKNLLILSSYNSIKVNHVDTIIGLRIESMMTCYTTKVCCYLLSFVQQLLGHSLKLAKTQLHLPCLTSSSMSSPYLCCSSVMSLLLMIKILSISPSTQKEQP